MGIEKVIITNMSALKWKYGAAITVWRTAGAGNRMMARSTGAAMAVTEG